MVKHVVLWSLKDEFSDSEKKEISRKIKNDIEALAGLNGVIAMRVYIDPSAGSDCDILLDSEFENEEALNKYQKHPAHSAVKDYIASVRKERKCFDGLK